MEKTTLKKRKTTLKKRKNYFKNNLKTTLKKILKL